MSGRLFLLCLRFPQDYVSLISHHRLFVEADHEASIKLLVRDALQDALVASGLNR